MAKYQPISKTSSYDSDNFMVTIDESDLRLTRQNGFGVIDWIILCTVYITWFITLPFTWCFSFKVIPQYQRIVIFRLGRLMPLQGPGLIFIIPLVDKWIRADLRMRAFSVPPHEVLTINGRYLKVAADVQYRVADPIKAHGLVKDLDHSLRVTAHSVLNTGLSCKKPAEIEQEKSYLGITLQAAMNRIAYQWGVEIARFELTQIIRENNKYGNKDDEFQDPMSTIVNLVKSMANPSSSVSMGPGISGMSLRPMLQNNQQQHQRQPNATNQVLQPAELFEMLKIAVDNKTAREIGAVFLFDLDGENGGQWFADFKSEPFVIGQGVPSQMVDVTFRLPDDLFIDIFYQRITPTEAYFTGRLAIDGNTQTALGLEKVIEKIKGS